MPLTAFQATALSHLVYTRSDELSGACVATQLVGRVECCDTRQSST